jgi:UDP-glucose 4-epimerase
MDIAEAHMLAMRHLGDGGDSRVYNLGTGTGHSVREVIKTAERVTGKRAAVEEVGRRPGDPATLVASSDKIKSELGWKPKFTDLKLMVEHAWSWMKEFPGGYDH